MLSTDPLFLQQLQQAELPAIKKLYHLAYKNCSEMILLNKGSEKQARSIFQEALLLFIKKIQNPQFEFNVSPEVYIYSLCRNLWLNEAKLGFIKEVSNALPFIEIEGFSPNNIVPQKQQIINKILNELGAECKQLLVSFYFKKMSIKEISEQLNLSVAYVKVHKTRCMENLKQKITELLQKQESSL